jgi:Predicted membrane protein (DUF2339)
VSTAT